MLKTVGNITKEAIKARVIDVKIMWVSNYRYPITKSSNWIPVIGQPRDRAPINNGDRTEWSPIRSVIIRVINKIGRPRSGSPIC